MYEAEIPTSHTFLKAAISMSTPSTKTTTLTLGLDLDGVITEAPEFFSAWTHSWPGKVIVITYRNDRQKAITDVESRNIRYDEIILVDRFDAKAEVIRDKGVNIYVDDQPEMLKNISHGCHIMLFRNDGNFDTDDQKWMLSSETGKLVC